MRFTRLAAALLLAVALLTAPPVRNALASTDWAPVNVGLSNFSTYAAGSTVAVILPRNVNRAGLIVQNNGAVSIVIKPGGSPSTFTDGIVLTSGSIWNPQPPPVDALYTISTSAAGTTARVIMIENIR